MLQLPAHTFSSTPASRTQLQYRCANQCHERPGVNSEVRVVREIWDTGRVEDDINVLLYKVRRVRSQQCGQHKRPRHRHTMRLVVHAAARRASCSAADTRCSSPFLVRQVCITQYAARALSIRAYRATKQTVDALGDSDIHVQQRTNLPAPRTTHHLASKCSATASTHTASCRSR
jgi:hypothetical protein